METPSIPNPAADGIDLALKIGNQLAAPTLDHQPLLLALAERQLAAALFNYTQVALHRADTLVTYLDLTVYQRNFFTRAIPTVMSAIFQEAQ